MPANESDEARGLRRSEIRVRIARLRRRIDREVEHVVDRSMQWVALRGYVARYPARSLAAAAAAGMTAALALSKVRVPESFGVRLYDLATSGAWSCIWRELCQVCLAEEGAAKGPAVEDPTDG